MKRQNKKAVQAYISRIVTSVGKQNPITLLSRGPSKVSLAVRGLTSAQVKRKPGKDRWSIHEIVGHLVDVEVAYGWRLRRAMAEPGACENGFDQDRWAAVFNYRRMPFKVLLQAYEQLRKANVSLLKALPPGTKERGWFMHSERGREKGKHILTMLAGHDLSHLKQIKEVRSRFGW